MAIFSGGIFTKRRELESFYVNAYGNKQTRGVYTFTIDVGTGELFPKSHFKTPTDPVYSFDFGRFVCTTYKNRTGTSSDGGICSYASTAQTLALVSRLSDSGKTYLHACTNRNDDSADRIFGVDFYNGEIMVGLVKKKKLIKPLSVYELEGHSIHPQRQNMPHPHHVCMLPNSDKLCVTDLGQDKILIFDVLEDGTLQMDEERTLEVKPGNGPREILFTTDGSRAYIVNELANTISLYTLEGGFFTYVDEFDTYDKTQFPDETNTAAQMKITSDGQFAIVLNRGHDSVTLFSIDQETGKLIYRDFADTSANPRTVELFRDRWLVIGCQKGGIIEVVEISREKKGLLFEKDYSYLINEPVCIKRFVDIMDSKNK